MYFKIRKGQKKDAEFLSRTVTGALGEELCLNLAGNITKIDIINNMFARLCQLEDSQYSYRNALIAEDENGTSIGAIIGYDGAKLPLLRKRFIEEANNTLEWNITPEEEKKMVNEAEEDEFYLDSLFVSEKYRGHGLGSSLIRAAIDFNSSIGKPFGLLVEPSNEKAKKLYQKLGFEEIGLNYAFGIPMIHMQIEHS